MSEQRFYSHSNPAGEGPADRARASGYDAQVDENIGRGVFGGSAVVHGWMTRSTSRERITDCTYAAVGIGEASNLLTRFWTQVLGVR